MIYESVSPVRLNDLGSRINCVNVYSNWLGVYRENGYYYYYYYYYYYMLIYISSYNVKLIRPTYACI